MLGEAALAKEFSAGLFDEYAQNFQIIHKTNHHHNITTDTSPANLDVQIFPVL